MKFADLNVSIDAPRNSVDMSKHWGEGVTIYATPLTAKDLSALTRRHKGFMSSPSAEAMVDMIILKAENADGEKFFTKDDKMKLMRLPADQISDAAMVVENVDAEEVAKN
jgi:hypothetical protein